MAYKEDDGLVWKRMNGCSDEASVSSQDEVWDDTALIEAYDRAVKKLKDEIVAEASGEVRTSTKHKKERKREKKPERHWEEGCKCLALYSEDQLYYEAEILSIYTENQTAYVRFDHYDNEENVYTRDLLPLEYKEELEPAKYTEEENVDITNDDEEEGAVNYKYSERLNQDQVNHNWKVSDLCYVPDVRGGYIKAVLNEFLSSKNCNVTLIETGKKRKVRINEIKTIEEHKKIQHNTSASKNFDLPFPGSHFHHQQSPHPFPAWHTVNNRNCYMPGMPVGFPVMMATPPPPPLPPPPLLTDELIRGDEEALANMLTSWYMSGYHTGFYRGLQQARGPERKKK